MDLSFLIPVIGKGLSTQKRHTAFELPPASFLTLNSHLETSPDQLILTQVFIV
jgi:hypothetical protein